MKEGKEVRLKAFGSCECDLEILVKIGTFRHPLSVNAARELQRLLDDALGKRP